MRVQEKLRKKKRWYMELKMSPSAMGMEEGIESNEAT
jgi:hypothetical protein